MRPEFDCKQAGGEIRYRLLLFAVSLVSQYANEIIASVREHDKQSTLNRLTLRMIIICVGLVLSIQIYDSA